MTSRGAHLLLVPVSLLLVVFLAPAAPATSPARAPAMDGRAVKQVDAGIDFTCAVTRGGQGYCWGDGEYGVLGNGSRDTQLHPTSVSQEGAMKGEGFVSISAGQLHACGISQSRRVFCWGRSLYGALGIGDVAGIYPEPQAVDRSGVLRGKTIVDVTAGANNSCALDRRGRAYCWGSNFLGGIGDGTTRNRKTPVRVDMSGALRGRRLVKIVNASNHACALDSRGRAYCWGSNDRGALGIGSFAELRLVPTRVDTSGVLKRVDLVDISVGYDHTCAVGSNGRAYCWGRGAKGALGTGDTRNSRVPVAVDRSGVLRRADLVSVDGSTRHTCVSAADGRSYCWGFNRFGRLGDGSTRTALSPVRVDARNSATGTFTGVTAGATHSCAIDAGGAAYCWGRGRSGALGSGGTGTQLLGQPVQGPPG